MQDWPMAEHFQIVRHAKRLADLEEIRRSLDFWQAYRDESRRLRGKKPSPKNLRLLVHKDLITHINDIRQDPPPGFTVVNNPTPEELEMMTLAGVHDRRQGRRLPYVIISFRQPQPGLSLRTFKSRYPKNKQKPIIFEVDRMLFAPPSLDQSPNGDGED